MRIWSALLLLLVSCLQDAPTSTAIDVSKRFASLHETKVTHALFDSPPRSEEASVALLMEYLVREWPTCLDPRVNSHVTHWLQSVSAIRMPWPAMQKALNQPMFDTFNLIPNADVVRHLREWAASAHFHRWLRLLVQMKHLTHLDMRGIYVPPRRWRHLMRVLQPLPLSSLALTMHTRLDPYAFDGPPLPWEDVLFTLNDPDFAGRMAHRWGRYTRLSHLRAFTVVFRGPDILPADVKTVFRWLLHAAPGLEELHVDIQIRNDAVSSETINARREAMMDMVIDFIKHQNFLRTLHLGRFFHTLAPAQQQSLFQTLLSKNQMQVMGHPLADWIALHPVTAMLAFFSSIVRVEKSESSLPLSLTPGQIRLQNKVVQVTTAARARALFTRHDVLQVARRWFFEVLFYLFLRTTFPLVHADRLRYAFVALAGLHRLEIPYLTPLFRDLLTVGFLLQFLASLVYLCAPSLVAIESPPPLLDLLLPDQLKWVLAYTFK